MRSIRIYALYFPAIEVLISVALASLIVAGADRAAANTLTVGTVAAFLQFVRRFFQPLQGPLGEVQHPAGGDGLVGANLPVAGHSTDGP